MTVVRAVVLLAAAALVAACHTEGAAGWELDGEPVSDQQLVMMAGPEHCDWTSVTFLWVAWPVGTRGEFADDGRQYVRDPDGLVFSEGLDLDARLPEDAAPSGFRTGEGRELWFAGSDGAEIAYLVDPSGDVEAWPRADPIIACA